ncbi:exosome nuclease subunit [Pseudocyphellaria aurata]|nr:exosome nuclease subunit [Pseudocyphellaria aurata]
MADDEAFKEARVSISSALVEVTRTVGRISSEDLAFQRSSNPSIAPLLDEQASNLLNLVQDLTKISASGTEVTPPRLLDADSVEDNWKNIVDVIDNLLEKADACLDEYTGVIKKLSPSQENQASTATSLSRRHAPTRNYRDQYIPKPQLLFEKVTTNDETTPFKPLLRSKPHALVPLPETLRRSLNSEGNEQYNHPYKVEIENSRYPASVHMVSEPIPPLPFESTQATLVDSREGVEAMLKDLKLAKEIAVDLEHHDAHSFIGLVSLMQISTRDQDWVVDTLKPWRTDLEVLNEVFADPKIVKVFHGSFMDMLWLQRDLGLYVVGLFDTYHASQCLGYPRHSLAALLKRFVDFDADKQYQLADWRIRPLPKEMLDYARCDTHFLLYIYDKLRNNLLAESESDPSLQEGTLIDEVLRKSKKEALQRYEWPFYDAQRGKGTNGWYKLLERTPALFNREQLSVFRAVHQWRDQLARKEDEGPNQIMRHQVLFNIARQMPMDMPSLLGCSHPISAAVRPRIGDLIRVIQEAKTAGANGPDMTDLISIEQAKTNHLQAQKIENSFPSTLAGANNRTLSIQAPRSNLPVRTNVSAFWGKTLEESTSMQQKRVMRKQHESHRLVLPLPSLTAEVFKDSTAGMNSVVEPNQHDPGARAEHQYVKRRMSKQNDVFVVRQAGGSRKRKADGMEDFPETAKTAVPTNPMVIEGVEPKASVRNIEGNEIKQLEDEVLTQQRQSKRQKKKLKKDRKRKREELKQVGGVNKGDVGAEEPFDYANAPSILHAKKSRIDQTEGKNSFDPYAKSLDTSKGMRKMQKEVGGRSFTFKN